jgi:dTDP-glucose pyrophosphorylase
MISNFLIGPDSTIKQSMDQLDLVKGLGLIVVDENKKLLGSLTDGDIRRALTGLDINIDSSIEKIYHRNPKYVLKGSTDSDKEKITENNIIKVVPIIENGIVVDVFTVDHEETKDISVVIMAGGLGSRLGEHTKNCPKPMLEVAGKPVLERILNNFTHVGFEKFFFSVNFMAEFIENHFKDGQKFNCNIQYLRETKRLGTAGSLSLLPKNVTGPIIVTNGDLLTLVDFRRLINFHKQHQSPITMCTRKYEFQVPFGVVNIDSGLAKGIDEKPTQSFNISAGVYVIDSKLLSYIPVDEYHDMPTFLENLIAKNNDVHCFPLVEQWIDIGKVDDLNFAREKYSHE